MLEIIMLIAGLYALIAGRIPNFLFGGKDYIVESTHARLIGLLMMTPVPLAFMATFMLGILFGEEGANYGFLCELGIVIVVAIAATVIVRQVRKPQQPANLDSPSEPSV